MSTRFLTLNGAKLLVDIQGQGQPIIVHHGAPGLGSHATPKRAFEPLTNSYQLLTFDARGSGQSEVKPPFSHKQFVEDLEALRKHFGFETFILTGGSYGGFISLEYALTYPEHVSHLILRDTAASNRFEVQAKKNALARSDEFPNITEDMLERLFAGQLTDDEDFCKAYKAIAPLYATHYDPEKIAEQLKAIRFHALTHNAAFSLNLPNYSVVNRLHELSLPTLIVVGRHDWITPVEASEELAQHIPNAELIIFENSGHSPQLEENERFIHVVRNFLKGHSS